MQVLALGGTGAMGTHVCKLLADEGCFVVCTTRQHRHPENPNIQYACGNARDQSFLDSLLAKHWDAIIDFMVWSTTDFMDRYQAFLAATDQYVFLSSYRVYANSPMITEESPRLLDVVKDEEYLKTDEYALSKARCENLLFQSATSNWTIVRPAITYDGSVGRLQLAVLESDVWLWRASRDIAIPLPEEMLSKQATMTWGFDVASMIARLVGKPQALGEAFTVATSEHRSWLEIIEIYQRCLPTLRIIPCDLRAFEKVRGGIYQIRYDRMFDRVVDNSKALKVTGLSQSDIAPVEKLEAELELFLKSHKKLLSGGVGMNAKLDRLVGGMPSFAPLLREKANPVQLIKYSIKRII